MIRIRIARLTLPAARHEAPATLAAFRDELAQLATSGRLPAVGAARPLAAVTPAGRGREAARLLAPDQRKDADR